MPALTESLRRWWRAPTNAEQYRWLLEPMLGVVFFGLWVCGAALMGDLTDPSGILLLTMAISVSRVSPGGALAFGVLALVVLIPGAHNGAVLGYLAVIEAGIVVFFAASAYGNRTSRWVGLIGAAVVSAGVSLAVLPLSVLPDSWPLSGHQGGLTALALFLGAQFIAGLVVGSWVLGLLLRRRAREGIPALGSVEAWLLGAVGVGDHPVITPSRLIRAITPRQFMIDVAIAIGFVALDMVTSAQWSVQSSIVLLTLALAIGARRLAPTLSLSGAWLAAILQMLFGLDVVTADFAILIVLYASAAYGGRITKWAGLASVGVGALLATGYVTLRSGIPDAGIGSSTDFADGLLRFVATLIASIGVLGLAWTLGLLVRTWQTARSSKRMASLALQEQKLAERSVVVEQERNRIARDMHDVVAHSLAVVIAQADGARYARASDPSAVDTALTTISSTAREALGDVRLLLAQLRQDEAVGPQPMLADLDRLVDQMRNAGLVIVWRVTGDPHTLGSGAQLATYRIIQEALTNALRHGDPGADVGLAIGWDPAGVSVVVSNAIRERTADAVTAAGSVGHGLPGMRERALLAGGSLHAEALHGRFTVTARIPAGRLQHS